MVLLTAFSFLMIYKIMVSLIIHVVLDLGKFQKLAHNHIGNEQCHVCFQISYSLNPVCTLVRRMFIRKGIILCKGHRIERKIHKAMNAYSPSHPNHTLSFMEEQASLSETLLIPVCLVMFLKIPTYAPYMIFTSFISIISLPLSINCSPSYQLQKERCGKFGK